MASLTLLGEHGVVGRMVCACDHLTEFAVIASVLSRPDAFFSSLGRLKINLPAPLRYALWPSGWPSGQGWGRGSVPSPPST